MASLLHSHLPTLLGARGKDLKHIQPMLLRLCKGQLILTREVQPLQHDSPHLYFQLDFLTLRSHFQHNQAAEHKWWLGGAIHSTMSVHTQVLSLGKGLGGDEAETQKILNKN